MRHDEPPRGLCVARSHRGFTLIEAMVVVAMLGIVAAIAAPSFTGFIGTMNAKAAAFDLISDLTTARSEAIKRNADTTLVPISGNWSNGWQIAAEGTILRERGALASSITVTGAPGAGVQFRSNGRLRDDETLTRWTVKSSIPGVIQRCVIVTPTGSARSRAGAC